jgi:hypothetical protein
MFAALAKSTGAIIGVVTLAMAFGHMDSTTATAWDSNAKGDIANIRAVEATEHSAGNDWVTDLNKKTATGLRIKLSAGSKDEVLASPTGYVIVTKSESGDVFVSTADTTQNLGAIDHAVVVLDVSGLPVPASTVALAVDHYTIRSHTQAPASTTHAVSTNHLVVKKLDTEIAPIANGFINWLTSLKNLLGVRATTKNQGGTK